MEESRQFFNHWHGYERAAVEELVYGEADTVADALALTAPLCSNANNYLSRAMNTGKLEEEDGFSYKPSEAEEDLAPRLHFFPGSDELNEYGGQSHLGVHTEYLDTQSMKSCGDSAFAPPLRFH